MCAFLCEALFGLSYIFTKQATAGASVLALLGWRFLIAMLCMHICVVFHIASIDLKKKNIKPLLIIAFFSPLTYFIGETIGISKTTASESGVFLACIPISALLASTFILHKKTYRKTDRRYTDYLLRHSCNCLRCRNVHQSVCCRICISFHRGHFLCFLQHICRARICIYRRGNNLCHAGFRRYHICRRRIHRGSRHRNTFCPLQSAVP